MAKKSFHTISLEFCGSLGLKYKCSKILPPSNSKDRHARRDIQEIQPQLPLLCRRISSILTVSRVSCWLAPDTHTYTHTHTHIYKGLVFQHFQDYLEYSGVHALNSLFVTCSRLGLSFLPPFNPISRGAFCIIENREENFVYKVIQHLCVEDKISISKEKVGLSCRCLFPKLGDSGFPFDWQGE